jgi:VIT1/CCC1 family predicted Fe2+/Mn2+ transporter
LKQVRSRSRHPERHVIHRVGWLRAAVLGANDGILSTSSLVIGIAASSASHEGILISGVAGLVAGSMSMAAGEYVSVSSQSDTEKADIAVERREQSEDPRAEHAELAAIYHRRGLDKALSKEVARQLMAKDALGAHVRDELGISSPFVARPLQAALTSAISFALGAAIPVAMVALAPEKHLIPWVAGVSLVFLAVLGAAAAKAGHARVAVGAVRVMFWGALAMALTAGVGALFGAKS